VAAPLGSKQREVVIDTLGTRVGGRKPHAFLGRGESAVAAFPAPSLIGLQELKKPATRTVCSAQTCRCERGWHGHLPVRA
jgi:hypothetical protein